MSSSAMLRYRLPFLVGLLLFGVIGFVTTASAALPSTPPPDPLSAYDALMPGMVLDSLTSYDCTVTIAYPHSARSMFYCRFEPGEGRCGRST
jgi:hypothetical protein